MSRGMWRWWETKNGADIWSAHIEDTPGQWRDISESEYRRLGLEPSFWDLPLNEDYLATAGPRDIQAEVTRLRSKYTLPAILIVAFVFFAGFTIYVAEYALLVKLHILR